MISFKKEIAKALSAELKQDILEDDIEVPPDPKMGDYAYPCFSLSKNLRKNPAEIAKDLTDKIKPKYISDVNAMGPFLNFFISKQDLAKHVLSEIYKCKTCYGSRAKQNYTIMIESPGPNTNKPLHLGHVRNMLLGNSLINIYKFLGYDTVRVDIINDRGVHICKSMLAYKYFGDNKDPDKKPDHFVGEFYVRYAKELPTHPEFEQEIKEMLLKWELGDIETRELWKKMNNWALEGFKVTYDRYGVKMDKPYYESDHYTKGREIIMGGLKKKIFSYDENDNIIIDLTNEGLGKKVVLRADGTSIYITQDIALGKLRFDDFGMNKMIYIVASEQIHHFQVLFKIFELLEFSFAHDCYHLAYGMVYLPEGKMKSREGRVVDADNLADEMHESAKKEIMKRYPEIDAKELEARSEAIGMGAIKFFILKYDALKDFVFNPKESLSFEGETGPYVQYSHARCCSVLKKYKKKVSDKIDFSLLNTAEDKSLIKLLYEFPSVIKKAGDQYKPNLVTRHLLDLSQTFNEYYHKHKILQGDMELEKARILLVYCVKQVLRTGLELLGIQAIEEM